MEQYKVKGMSCAACVSRVEKAVSKVEGVEAVTVSLMTNSMTVEGSALPETVIRAVKNAGYGAKRIKPGSVFDTDPDAEGDFRKIRKRFIVSLGILLVLMYVSMGHHMFGWPLPGILSSHTAVIILEAVLSLAILLINIRFFRNGFKGVIHLSPNMDTLVALGSGVSFVYSVVLSVLYLAKPNGEMPALYFESASMILVLITLGKMLEAYSKGKTTSAIDALKDLAPKMATVMKDGKEVLIPAAELSVGDVFLVRPGESFPADGTVSEGTSAVNESALTGESIPVDKEPGDHVSAGTVNQTGTLVCVVTVAGEETMLARIIRLVTDSNATKAPVARLADRIAGVFVPVVIGIAAVTFAVWMIINGDLPNALTHAISVLVVSCPCALGLATPVAIMVGSGVGARNGLLFKTAASLEITGRSSKIVLDKTGTITKGLPEVTDVCPADGISQEELLKIAYALEKNSEHP
ncbi:MAG: heavy metal translocating P-type ATPase, partial [Lachnospiraceae bacterium]|nr:heavy metal translocating P-type ATPase [Lachnospiraceae bacterium]